MKNSKFWFVIEWDENGYDEAPIVHPVRESSDLAWKDAKRLAAKYDKEHDEQCVKFTEGKRIRLDHSCENHFFEVRSITIPSIEYSKPIRIEN